jgi:sec-independent protein translocase protein TatB
LSGVGISELLVLFVIGLLILGPERLPRVAAQIGRWVGRARRTANQLRYQLEREIALADIEKNSKDRKDDKSASAKPGAEENPSEAQQPEDSRAEKGASEAEGDADSEEAARTDSDSGR